jgi:diguanylate cyclase (GGDEF)-like protein/PAS domain S-box-containing protein
MLAPCTTDLVGTGATDVDNMKNRYRTCLREYAPPLLVMALCSLVTIAAFVMTRQVALERASFHAAADAAQYQHTLQQGLSSYMQLSRGLASYIAASERLSANSFDAYLRSANVLRDHPGLSYIGYIARVARAGQAAFEEKASRDAPGYRVQLTGPDPSFIYPYLHAYPQDRLSAHAKGLDFSAVPQRWAAMQQARDSGKSTATSQHFFVNQPVSAATTKPIIAVFTPIYDLSAPVSTVAERRAALRGFIFSLYRIDEIIDRVMGSGFNALFDLEIFDGTVQPANILYDGDRRPHAVLADPDFPVARHAAVSVANREWHLLFYAEPRYTSRFSNGHEYTVLVLELGISMALSYATLIWTMRLRMRSLKHAQSLRFESVFENHPSGVYSLDLKGRFLNANSQALKELKTGKAALTGTPAENFITPECRQRAREAFAQALDENSLSFDSALIDGEGGRIELSVILIPFKQDGATVSVLGIAQNVTERKMSEWRLRESKQMLRLVINNVPQRVFWKDPELRYLGCNRAFCEDAGLMHPDEIIGKTDFELSWHANAEAYRRDDRETLDRNQAKINFEEMQNREDGSEHWLRTSKIPLSDFEGRTMGLLCMYEDITPRKMLERQLHEMAHFDSLTGLANRALFSHHLEHAVTRAKHTGSWFALMYLDLDKFKSVNDTLGHDAGDELLRAFAQRIKIEARETDVVARLGGDEFGILLEDLPNRAAAETVALKLVKAMEAPVSIHDAPLIVSTSIGIAFSGPEPSADDVMRRVDQAMYTAKRGGRNRFSVDRS